MTCCQLLKSQVWRVHLVAANWFMSSIILTHHLILFFAWRPPWETDCSSLLLWGVPAGDMSIVLQVKWVMKAKIAFVNLEIPLFILVTFFNCFVYRWTIGRHSSCWAWYYAWRICSDIPGVGPSAASIKAGNVTLINTFTASLYFHKLAPAQEYFTSPYPTYISHISRLSVKPFRFCQVRALPKLRILVMGLLKSLSSIAYIGLLLLLLFYLYAVLGNHRLCCVLWVHRSHAKYVGGRSSCVRKG